jgi:hypothetical protein
MPRVNISIAELKRRAAARAMPALMIVVTLSGSAASSASACAMTPAVSRAA